MSWWRRLFRRTSATFGLGAESMYPTLEDDLRRRAENAEHEVKRLKKKAEDDRLDALERAADPDGLTHRESKVQDAVDEHGSYWVLLDEHEAASEDANPMYVYTVRTSWKGVFEAESDIEYSDDTVAVEAAKRTLKHHGIDSVYPRRYAGFEYGSANYTRTGWDLQYDRPKSTE